MLKSGKIICTLFLFVLSWHVKAQVDIDVLKTVYIERITRFIEWPENKLSDTSSVVIVGVINNPGLAKKMHDVLNLNKIKNKKVEVISLNKGENLSNCHICFLDNFDENELDFYVRDANQNSVLLFTQQKRAASDGVHINFYMENNKLQFEINQISTKKAGFKISHLLMKNARVI